MSIGAEGGSVLLPDGSGVVFPAGAVSSNLPITVMREDPSRWFEVAGGKVVLTTTAPLTRFQTEVEIRVPLPGVATPADSFNVLAGVLDTGTGVVDVEDSTIEVIDGKPFLVVRTDHFSSRVYMWFADRLGTQPPGSASVMAPYYGQGGSNFCWAASLQMVTQASNFTRDRSIWDIVGEMGIDEGGITDAQFRLSPTIDALVKFRTGVSPERMSWQTVNTRQMKYYVRRQIGVEGRPVAVYNSMLEHAVVIVGYTVTIDNRTILQIHDPKGVPDGTSLYRTMDWDAFTDGMGLRGKLATLVVPGPLQARSVPLAVNFLDGAFTFRDESRTQWEFFWDYTRSHGYHFRDVDPQAGAVASDPLPADMVGLAVRNVEISNPSRTDAHTVSVSVVVNPPSGGGRRIERRQVLTVGPNSTVRFRPPTIPVDSFRYNAIEPVQYLLTTTVRTSDEVTIVDEQSIWFRLHPIQPELTSVTPASASPGQTVTLRGKNLGPGPDGNMVRFTGAPVAPTPTPTPASAPSAASGAGVKADSVVFWSEEEVQVVVPEGASSGGVLVMRGEVPSNPLAFLLDARTVVSGTVTQSLGLGPTTLEATGSWSLTSMEGRLDVETPDGSYHILSFAPTLPAEFSFSFAERLEPASWVNPDGSRVEVSRTGFIIEADVASGSSSIPFAGSLTETGSGGTRSYAFTALRRGDRLAVGITVEIFVNFYDANGVLVHQNVKFNEGTVARFTVESRDNAP